MKKFLICLIFTVFALIMAFSLTSCNNDETSHIHNYSEWGVMTVPTCMKKGTKMQVCSSCGDINYDDIEITGHNYINYECIYCNTRHIMLSSITLPDYQNHKVEVPSRYLQQVINSKITDIANSPYIIKTGDSAYFTIKAYEYNESGETEEEKQGNEIGELRLLNTLIENIGSGAYDKAIEDAIIESQITFGETKKVLFQFPTDYINATYRGQSVYLELNFLNMACRNGDIADIDYTGYFIDEDEEILSYFDRGSMSCYIGSNISINDFENGIIGVLAGEDNKKMFTATFPDDYKMEEFKGKKVKFEVTVKGYFNVPTYDLDFVRANFGEYESIEAFEQDANLKYASELLLDYIMTNSQVADYPKSEYDNIKIQLKQFEANYLSQFDISLDEYIEDQFNTTLDEYIKSTMKVEMVYYAIAEKENITPTEQQVANAREALIERNKQVYIRDNIGATEAEALSVATNYVDNTLYKSDIYEEALIKCVKDKLYTITQMEILQIKN